MAEKSKKFNVYDILNPWFVWFGCIKFSIPGTTVAHWDGVHTQPESVLVDASLVLDVTKFCVVVDVSFVVDAIKLCVVSGTVVDAVAGSVDPESKIITIELETLIELSSNHKIHLCEVYKALIENIIICTIKILMCVGQVTFHELLHASDLFTPLFVLEVG